MVVGKTVAAFQHVLHFAVVAQNHVVAGFHADVSRFGRRELVHGVVRAVGAEQAHHHGARRGVGSEAPVEVDAQVHHVAVVVSEPVRNTPEQVWAGCCTSLSIQPRTEGQSVTLRPAEATAHYTVTIYKEPRTALLGPRLNFFMGDGRRGDTGRWNYTELHQQFQQHCLF